MGRIITLLIGVECGCSRFVPRIDPALATSKSELFRARNLLRGIHLVVSSGISDEYWICEDIQISSVALVVRRGMQEPQRKEESDSVLTSSLCVTHREVCGEAYAEASVGGVIGARPGVVRANGGRFSPTAHKERNEMGRSEALD